MHRLMRVNIYRLTDNAAILVSLEGDASHKPVLSCEDFLPGVLGTGGLLSGVVA